MSVDDPFASIDIDDLLAELDEPYDWLVPGLIERGDRTIVTGGEGDGKSTLLRQFGVQCASGLHPFGGADFAPLRVLHVECENGRRQTKRQLRPLRAAAGDRYRGGYRYRFHTDGVALTNPAHEAWLSTVVAQAAPDLLIIGPLYKVVGGDPVKEEPALAAATALDRIRKDHRCAVLIEAHSAKKSGQATRRAIEPYGASLWLRWPEFGYHLAPDGAWLPWRGDRETREWPTRLRRGEPWPWMPAEDVPHWDGPTACMADVFTLIVGSPGVEYSGSSLIAALRSTGGNYRDRTVREAAERLALDGKVSVRSGTRGARIYSSRPTLTVVRSDP